MLQNKIITKLVIPHFFLLLSMFVCCMFSQFAFFTYISLGLSLIYALSLYIFMPQFYIKYLTFVFSAVAAIVSAVIIEFNNLYMVELQTVSSFEGSVPLLVFSYCLFLSILLLIDFLYGMSPKIPPAELDNRNFYPHYMVFFTYFTLFVNLILWLRIITKPAFLIGVNRFVYARLYLANDPRILSIFRSISTVLQFFPIISFINGYKKIGILTILIYCLYCLWIGNKFGSFFTLLCIILLILYPNILRRNLKKIKKAALIGMIFLFIIGSLSLIIQKTFTSDNTSNYFLYRISGQSELWWKTYSKSQGILHMNEFGDEINGLLNGEDSISKNVGSKYGIYKIMYLCAPKSVVDSKLNGGSRYTEAGFAAAYYYLGYGGCILYAILMGGVISLTVNGFVNMVKSKRYIRALILLRLYLVGQTTFSMFLFNGYIDLISLLSYIILIVSHFKPLKIRIYGRETVVL